MKTMMVVVAILLLVVVGVVRAEVVCDVGGCQAWALFVVPSYDTLYVIASRFHLANYTVLQSLNNINDPNNILPGQLLRIPFDCSCPSKGATLSHLFSYSVIEGDQVETIAKMKFSNLTTVEAIDSTNVGAKSILPSTVLQVPVNCSCGDTTVSKEYGMFGTYAAQPNDTLSSLSLKFGISQELLRNYNPAVSFDPLQPFVSILFIPTTNSSGQYPPVVTSQAPAGRGGGPGKGIIIIAGTAGGICILLFGLGLWLLWAKCIGKSHKFSNKDKIRSQPEVEFVTASPTPTEIDCKTIQGPHPADHCVNFSYYELALATENFSLSRQIGKGGYATVFYGEWQGQKLAVKKMEMESREEFLNELTILSRVHHATLVNLIGYCSKGGHLFLVYEYVDNETLYRHLRYGRKPLQWATRVQVALDAARGVEYLHDHTRPTYIHRDLKPSNILLDSNFHAKVGDFGLTRLIDPDGEGCTRTAAARGTYGYMAPEYAQYGTITVKLDVYAFGVILFQLVSGREALDGAGGVVPLFEEVLKSTDAEELVKSLIDPALGSDYPFESVWKMVRLASRCTQKNPDLRPLMREVAMQLMMLSDVRGGEDLQS